MHELITIHHQQIIDTGHTTDILTAPTYHRPQPTRKNLKKASQPTINARLATNSKPYSK